MRYVYRVDVRDCLIFQVIDYKLTLIARTIDEDLAKMIVQSLNGRDSEGPTETSNDPVEASDPSPVEPTVTQCQSRYMNTQCGNFFGHKGDHSNTRHQWINSEWEYAYKS